MSESIQSNSSAVKSSSDLPPPRDRKGIRPVSPPLANTPLHRFNYYLVLLATVFGAFYTWRILHWKTEHPPGAEALARNSDSSPSTTTSYASPSGSWSKGAKGHASVEDRINELAAALGMPSSDLAAAIADAVREHVPPASLSSVAAHEPSGTAAKYLVNPSAAADEASSGAASAASGGMAAVASAFEAAVGLDEPPTELGAM